jgi:RNA polymerase sigma factor (TIGR02999 family)
MQAACAFAVGVARALVVSHVDTPTRIDAAPRRRDNPAPCRAERPSAGPSRRFNTAAGEPMHDEAGNRQAAIPAPRGQAPGELTQLLQRWSQGDEAAFDRMVPMVYDELRRMAQRHLRHERGGHTLQGTSLVHEVYLRVAEGGPVQWQSRAKFFGWVSTLMRHILIDHARSRQAAKRGGGAELVSLDALRESGGDAAEPPASMHAGADVPDLVAIDQALQRLERLDPQQGRVVELRFFCGLSVAETAEALNISPATVKREWMTARAWLLRELGRLEVPA